MIDRLNLTVAQALVTALDQVREQKLPIAVSVVDTADNLLAFARMVVVGAMAVEVTRRKVVTAVNFGQPSNALLMIVNSDPAVAADFAKNPDICMVAGGVPIMTATGCVGGLGIGGGRSEQDRALA
jgi:glc operon protein GlcG